MKNRITYIAAFAAVLLAFTACGDFFTPDDDNVYTEEMLTKHPEKAEGVLLNAYNLLPSSTQFPDVATDDAVSNYTSNGYRKITNGGWSANNNPLSIWGTAYQAIAYINLFLDEIVDRTEWSYSSEWQNEQYKIRLSAEARALRAYYYTALLRAHAGIGAESGKLLGVPMILTSLNIGDNVFVPRNGYDECVAKTLEDLDFAIANLPDTYKDAPDDNPLKADYDAVYGSRMSNRIDRRAAMMIKARLLLQAASPAFNLNNDVSKWAAAADAAAELIDLYGGTAALAPSRLDYYLNENESDNLWRQNVQNIRSWEINHFPPSLFGSGRLNPTQNLVDAFPMANGYPIDNVASGYNASSPYSNRDPRLAKYIIFNGSKFKGTIINTINGATDGVDMVAESSTRTGYYLRKLMNENVSLTPEAQVSARHFNTLMRYTEAYLIYAEAACNAWGADGKGSHSYSAREVVAALRSSAGISQPDTYLNTLPPAEVLELIHNERRLELSFEGNRFWDVRRWKEIAAMRLTARGTKNGGKSSFDVEARQFQDYMIYGPLPKAEADKGLEQNAGW